MMSEELFDESDKSVLNEVVLDESLCCPACFHEFSPEKRARVKTESPEAISRYHSSEWKSECQKQVRIGNVDRAVNAASIWFDLDKDDCLRRLPIIAVEDCSWRVMANAVYVAQQGANFIKWGKRDIAKNLVKCLTAELAAMPKDKDAGAVRNASKWMAHSKGKEYAKVKDWEKWLRYYVDAKKEVEAAAVLFPALEDEGYKKIYDELQAMASERGSECIRAVDACRYRAAIGGRGCDILIITGGALLAVLRSEKINHSDIVLDDINWRAFDEHTRIGKAAQSIVAKKKELDREKLKKIHFFFESARISPRSAEHIHYDDAMRYLLGVRYPVEGLTTDEVVAKAREDWGKLRSYMKAIVEWLMKSENKESRIVDDDI